MSQRLTISPRLERRVRREFAVGSAAAALSRLASLQLALAGKQSTERIQTAIVVLAAGDLAKLEQTAQYAEVDWRDVLVWSGLAEATWPARLDEELGEG
jgi:hypothetical protein